jgi:hypothetical protein
MTNKQILAQIDWLGGLLSISGLVIFMAALQWGGYMVSSPCVHRLDTSDDDDCSINGVQLTSWFLLFWASSSLSGFSFGNLPPETSILCFLIVYDRTRGSWV